MRGLTRLSYYLLATFPPNANPFCHKEKPLGKTGIPSHRVGGTDLKKSEDGWRQAFCRSGICNLSGFQSETKSTGKYRVWSPSAVPPLSRSPGSLVAPTPPQSTSHSPTWSCSEPPALCYSRDEDGVWTGSGIAWDLLEIHCYGAPRPTNAERAF